MVRTALRARWLPRHVLMVVLVTALSLLGRWQWDVSQSARGALQNFLYAFQWWFMAAMVIYGWWRLLHDDTLKDTGKETVRHVERRAAAERAASVTGGPGVRQGPVGDDDSWHTRRSTAELIEAQLAEAGGGDGDDEGLAEYNEYLARLNARAQGMA